MWQMKIRTTYLKDLNTGQAATIIYAPTADFPITITGANNKSINLCKI